MHSLITLNVVLAYLAITYVVGAVWFLLIDRKDGFLKWRLIASTVAPIAVPVMLLIGISFPLLERAAIWNATRKHAKVIS
jgi:uncharacterized membrane protein